MRHQHGGLVAEHAAHAVLKDVVGGVVVHSRQGVVQQHQVAVKVGAAGQVEALALAARQVDAAQARLALVAGSQDLQVKLQGAGVDDLQARGTTAAAVVRGPAQHSTAHGSGNSCAARQQQPGRRAYSPPFL